MKNYHLSLCGLSAVFILSGCATALYPGGPTVSGSLITSVRSTAQHLAVNVDPQAQCVNEGSSTSGAFLGIFAFGDSSVSKAMKKANISRIHHIDHEVNSALFGLWLSDTTIVCGD